MKPPLIRVILGWMVHFYTACGLLVAAGIAVILMRPELTPADVRMCFLLMLLATFIDATDGTLARLVRIKETILAFDGRRLDDLTDFLTYACLPLWLIDRVGAVPEGFRWILPLALLAAAYGFCQTNIKTPDGSFVGFPSYWNIVAVFLYVLPVTGWPAIVFIGFFSLMTFVPSRYPYPSQPGRLNRVMLALSVPWMGLLLVVFLRPWEMPPVAWPEGDRFLARLAAAYPALYLLTAWGLSLSRLASGASSAR